MLVRRYLIIAALALLVALAGCGGSGELREGEQLINQGRQLGREQQALKNRSRLEQAAEAGKEIGKEGGHIAQECSGSEAPPFCP